MARNRDSIETWRLLAKNLSMVSTKRDRLDHPRNREIDRIKKRSKEWTELEGEGEAGRR